MLWQIDDIVIQEERYGSHHQAHVLGSFGTADTGGDGYGANPPRDSRCLSKAILEMRRSLDYKGVRTWKYRTWRESPAAHSALEGPNHFDIAGLRRFEAAGDGAAKSGFSRSFMRAAIEAMASIREWGGMLHDHCAEWYHVDNTMAGNTIMAYQGRAADKVALASSEASTDSDYRGLELLRNEFNNLKAWADCFVKARSPWAPQT